MPNQVSTVEVVSLDDGKDVTLKSLNVSRLRRFMRVWQEAMKLDPEDPEIEFQMYDYYIRVSGICLEKDLKDVTKVLFEAGDVLTDEYREYLEDNLDTPTIYRILEVCANVKLNDPKLMEAVEAARLAAILEQDGKNST